MGKQYNKVLKRRRRREYLSRKKELEKLNPPAKKKSPEKAAKPAPAKKTAAKPAAKKAAKKTAPAKKAPAKKSASKGDDLKKIEGIGPKAAEALVAAGVDTFAKLAKTDAAKIKEILVEASPRLAHLEPGSWPQQSELAAADKWDDLKVLQDKLDGGK